MPKLSRLIQPFRQNQAPELLRRIIGRDDVRITPIDVVDDLFFVLLLLFFVLDIFTAHTATEPRTDHAGVDDGDGDVGGEEVDGHGFADGVEGGFGAAVAVPGARGVVVDRAHAGGDVGDSGLDWRWYFAASGGDSAGFVGRREKVREEGLGQE